MTKIAISPVRPLEVDTKLATELQFIGQRAWSHAYGGDIPEEYIRRRYETRSIEGIERAITNLQISSHIGRLVVASVVEDDGSEPVRVGYAAASNELARRPIQRLTEKVKHPLKPTRIQLEELNVLPVLQGQGIGKYLLHQVFERFPGQQVPSVWVPEVGVAAKGLLSSMGFEKSPERPEPAMTHAFGQPAAFPPEAYYVAPSVSTVLDKSLPASP
jgi:GNAT superfamily N-acetyltransferase